MLNWTLIMGMVPHVYNTFGGSSVISNGPPLSLWTSSKGKGSSSCQERAEQATQPRGNKENQTGAHNSFEDTPPKT